MRMTSTGALPRTLAAARPPKPPPTITTRSVFDVCSSAPLIEFKLASFIYSFLKLLIPDISENLLLPRITRISQIQRWIGRSVGRCQTKARKLLGLIDSIVRILAIFAILAESAVQIRALNATTLA